MKGILVQSDPYNYDQGNIGSLQLLHSSLEFADENSSSDEATD